jgi:Peptidase inhibitor family I36
VKKILILMTVGAAMVSCGQGSVVDTPEKSESAAKIDLKQADASVGTGKLTAQAWQSCVDGQFCMWDFSNYGGSTVAYWNNISVDFVGGFINDKVTSFWNRTNHNVCIYEHSDFRGGGIILGPGFSTPDIGANTPIRDNFDTVIDSFNDKTSSVRGC